MRRGRKAEAAQCGIQGASGDGIAVGGEDPGGAVGGVWGSSDDDQRLEAGAGEACALGQGILEQFLAASFRSHYDMTRLEKGLKRRVSRTHRQGKEMWCYARDEGGPLEAGSQVQASNRCKLQPSRAAVVSVAGKPERDFGRYDPERRAQANRR